MNSPTSCAEIVRPARSSLCSRHWNKKRELEGRARERKKTSVCSLARAPKNSRYSLLSERLLYRLSRCGTMAGNSLSLKTSFLHKCALFISQVVLTFVQTRGYLESEYKVVTNFPRRDVSRIIPCSLLFHVWKVVFGRGGGYSMNRTLDIHSLSVCKALSFFSSARERERERRVGG